MQAEAYDFFNLLNVLLKAINVISPFLALSISAAPLINILLFALHILALINLASFSSGYGPNIL